jgi:hypothetical protein
MKFKALILAVAVSVAVPAAAHAQGMNPAQAAGLAQAVLGIAFGVMFPAPQCGPHDAMPPTFQPARPNYSPPPPYQPARPDYLPPPETERRANLEQHDSFDDDDDFDEDFQPVHRHPPKHAESSYSLQPETRPGADDTSDQSNLRPGDAEQPGDQPAAAYDEDQQPANPPVRHPAPPAPSSASSSRPADAKRRPSG